MLPLSPAFEHGLREFLAARQLNLDSPELARQVRELSDFYLQNPGAPTPWEKSFALPAYLAYFLPLNFVRLRAAWREVNRFLPESAVDEVWDFGAGLGTTQWVLESEVVPKRLVALERSTAAVNAYRELLPFMRARWTTVFTAPAAPAPKALAVFSYSFLEMQAQLPDLSRFEHLLIVEPSTRECGRALMEWRARLIARGFSALAPCTHDEDCPLLTQSTRDWCHMRVPFNAPDWWLALEEHLPMKNRTLTYSYLLASRSIRDENWRGSTRVIGDTLPENGKTRQMICRGPRREFLSWLHKRGPVPRIPHGALIRTLDDAEIKGAEVRPAGDLPWEF
jgi:hypothetical protein